MSCLPCGQQSLQSIRFVMENHNGTEQAFSVDKTGEIKLERTLDYETQMTHQFIVWVTDGLTVRFSFNFPVWFTRFLLKIHGQNDTATVEVTVLDVNDWDPRFELAEYEFIVKESALVQPFRWPDNRVGSIIGWPNDWAGTILLYKRQHKDKKSWPRHVKSHLLLL